MSEFGWGANVDAQFSVQYVKNLTKDGAKKLLGPGMLTNGSDHSVNYKPEDSDATLPPPKVAPAGTVNADGMSDPEVPSQIVKIGDGIWYVYAGGQQGVFVLTPQGSAAMQLPLPIGEVLLGASMYSSGRYPAAAFLGDRHERGDYGWDDLR